MPLKVLSPSEVDQFIDEGFVMLRGAFPSDVAAACRDIVWSHIAPKKDDPSTWTSAVVGLKDCFTEGPFKQVMTERLHGAFDDLLGEGRWKDPGKYGSWPVSFPGFDAPPWQPPAKGWHVDGNHFHHHLDSREQGLLPIFLFSDIAPGGGGTAVSLRSHFRTARILADAQPDGLHVEELIRRIGPHEPGTELEATGSAGDVALIHPFMMHSRSPNTGNAVRFICNPCYGFYEKMNLNRPNPDEYSPVERAIVKALK